MSQMLAFIVTGSAPEQRSPINARLKGWRLPKLKRFGRLHVVVPIDQKMRSRRRAFAKSPREDNRIAFGRAKPRLQADGLAMLMNPGRARRQVVFVLRLGRNAGKPHVLAQFPNKPVLVLFEVVQDLLHDGFVALAPSRCQATIYKTSIGKLVSQISI